MIYFIKQHLSKLVSYVQICLIFLMLILFSATIFKYFIIVNKILWCFLSRYSYHVQIILLFLPQSLCLFIFFLVTVFTKRHIVTSLSCSHFLESVFHQWMWCFLLGSLFRLRKLKCWVSMKNSWGISSNTFFCICWN